VHTIYIFERRLKMDDYSNGFLNGSKFACRMIFLTAITYGAGYGVGKLSGIISERQKCNVKLELIERRYEEDKRVIDSFSDFLDRVKEREAEAEKCQNVKEETTDET
jgi:hypothetical protein